MESKVSGGTATGDEVDGLAVLLMLLGAGAGGPSSSSVKESLFMFPNLRAMRRALADSGSTSHSSGASGDDVLSHTEVESWSLGLLTPLRVRSTRLSSATCTTA